MLHKCRRAPSREIWTNRHQDALIWDVRPVRGPHLLPAAFHSSAADGRVPSDADLSCCTRPLLLGPAASSAAHGALPNVPATLPLPRVSNA